MQNQEIEIDSRPDPEALARAVEIITSRRYRPGEAQLARYSYRIFELIPDTDYLARRGVDLIAMASAIERGLDVERFGQVIIYKDWPIDEFNLFNRSTISVSIINDAMKRFLDHPRNW